MVVYTCNYSCWGSRWRRIEVRSSLSKSLRLNLKNKRVG
jgi:hypothetical protein